MSIDKGLGNNEVGQADNTTSIDIKELLLASHTEITSLRKQVDEFSQNQHSPIAIVGIGCRFPGGCDNPDSYWQYIAEGNCAITEMTDERWDASLLYNADADEPGKIYTKHIGLIDDVEKFDAGIFNLPTAEVELMDPQQRILLMVCHEAIVNAGIDPKDLKGSKTGVFVGVSTNDYARLTLNKDVHPEIGGYACLGSAASVAAGRVSYLMDFHGPALTLDTSCSSSLLSVHIACENIRRGECDVALAGGINLILTPENSIGLSRMQALSPTGLCKTFDADADGYVRGEGCGVVVLKSLAQAEKDGDDIYAVIQGSAVNHDGASNGLTAPNGKMQEDVVAQALANAGVAAQDIHYVEAHGTGTNLGDPIEVNALARSLRSDTPEKPLLIGSVKTNIGHLEAAAGVAALIKMALSMKAKCIPPHLHFETPNPYISWDKYNLQVPVKTQEWPSDTKETFGSVSAFGLSGTNVHMVTSFYQPDAQLSNVKASSIDKTEFSGSSELLTISAKTRAALNATAIRWQAYLKTSNENFNTICKNSQVFRGGEGGEKGKASYRLALKAENRDQLLASLVDFQHDNENRNAWFSEEAHESKPNQPIAMLFSGQGSQYASMGQSLYSHSPVFRRTLDKCHDLYQTITGNSLKEIISDTSASRINNTQYTQPAIFCLQIALLEFWREKGIQPSCVIGHSIGEYAAAVAAKVMSLNDALNLVIKRGQLMVEHCEPGSMLAVRSDRKNIESLLKGYTEEAKVSIAAVNSEKNVVISGDAEIISKIKESLDEKKIKSTLLRVSHAFHSPLMQPMLSAFRTEVEKVVLHAPSIPFYSTVTGTLIDSELCETEYWVKQISASVDFHAAIKSLYNDDIAAFIEIGSGTTLTGLSALTLDLDGSKSFYCLREKENDIESINQAMAGLFVRGILDSKNITESELQKRLSIPAPAPDLKPYWCEYRPNYADESSSTDNDANELEILSANLIKSWEKIASLSDIEENSATEKWLVISESEDGMNSFGSENDNNSTFVSLSFSDCINDDVISTLGESSFSGIVVVDPVFEQEEINSSVISQKSYAIIALVNSLISNDILNSDGMLCFLSLSKESHNMSGVTQGAPIFSIEESISSLCRTLRLEYSAHQFQRFLVSSSSSHFSSNESALRFITQDMRHANLGDELLLNDGDLFSPVLNDAENNVSGLDTVAIGTRIKPTGSYLITGGVGALGLALAEHLAKQGAGQILLLTRRNYLVNEVVNRIGKIRELDCDVQVLSADVADTQTVESLLNSSLSETVPLAGVIHCAGVLEDQLASNIDRDSFDRVQSPKVEGALSLHRLSQNYSLDFFVLFGSVASSFGNSGQVAYSVANGFLQDLTRYRRAQGLPAQTISWGPWGGQGMAETSLVSALMKEMGIELLDVDDGLKRFDTSICREGQDAIIVNLNIESLQYSVKDLNFPGFLKEYVAQKYLTLSAKSSAIKTQSQSSSNTGIAKVCEFVGFLESRKPQPIHQSAVLFIRDKILLATANDLAKEYSATKPLIDMGFDSLMAVQLRNTLAKSTAKSLPVSLLFDYPSMDSLAAYLLQLCIEIDDKNVEEIQKIVSVNEQADIAIIGLGCRFPGGIDGQESFWQSLVNGEDSVTDIAKKRWDSELFFDVDPDAPGKMYSRWGGLLDNVDEFDNTFFGISGQEALVMDPQQRLLMEVGWQALESANIVPSEYVDAGVFVGCGPNEYTHILKSKGIASTNAYFGTGNSISVTAGRLAYYLGWQGPAMAIDTACSSSLVSINLACDSLRKGDCSLALAGGVNLTLSPQTNIALSKARMLSPVGRCKTFDNSADGYVRSEGCALVALKTLEQAQRDGDNIMAVIKGGAINHDGRSQGLTAPNGPSQERVMNKALARAKIKPEDIQYLETHGTGTPLGDPIEMNSIENVYAKERSENLYVGSVKTNIGHTEAAAGVASLIKVVLMLQHGQIVKHLHLDQLNEHFSEAVRSEDGKIKIPQSLIPWPDQPADQLKCAAVSSFGFSGTNAHLIIEEFPVAVRQTEISTYGTGSKNKLRCYDENSLDSEASETVNLAQRLCVFPLSAKTHEALQESVTHYIQYLSNKTIALEDLCYTAGTGREHFDYRQAFKAKDKNELITLLRESRNNNVRSVEEKSTIAFLFTGQGSQYVSMGKELFENGSVFKKTLEECDGLMQEILGESILDIMWGHSEGSPEKKSLNDAKINNTYYTQPSLFALEYALAQQWLAWGVQPDFVCGHSVGEYAAACLAGVFSLSDAVKLVCARSRLMVELCDTGAMLVLFADAGKSELLLKELAAKEPLFAKELSIAAENGLSNTVVSGSGAAIKALTALCSECGQHAQPLKVSHGFHSVLMKPMLDSFRQVVLSLKLNVPSIRFVSTLTGKEVSDECCQPEYWVQHVSDRVHFHAATDCLDNLGVNTFLEIGPANHLVVMARRNLPDTTATFLESMKRNASEWDHIMRAVGSLYEKRVNINWKKVYDSNGLMGQLSLPTYRFQRRRIWPQLQGDTLYPSYDESNTGPQTDSPLGRKTSLANGDCVYETQASANFPFDIEDHKLYETVVLPGASHLSMLTLIAQDQNWQSGYEVRDIVFPAAMIFPEDETKEVQYLHQILDGGGVKISAFSRILGEDSVWTEHYSSIVLPNSTAEGRDKQKSFSFDLNTWQEDLSEHISGETFYREMESAGYRLQQGFRWIEALWRKPGATLTRLRAPSSEIEKSYCIYPGLMDAFFQSTAAASDDTEFRLHDKEDIFIPMAVDAMAVYQKATGPLWCYVELLSNDAFDQTNSETFTHRISVFSDDGELLLWVDALRSKRAPKTVLLESLKKPSTKLIYQIQWQELALVSRSNDYVSEADNNKGLYLILASENHDRLVQNLRAQSWMCEAINLSDIVGGVDPKDRQQALAIKLDEILDKNKLASFSGVISLLDATFSDHSSLNEASIQSNQEHLLQPHLLIQQYCIEKGAEPNWLFVRANGGDDKRSPFTSSVLGYSRVLRNESIQSRVKHLTLDCEYSDDAYAYIIDEISSNDIDGDIRYEAGRRQVARFSPSENILSDSIASGMFDSAVFEQDKSYIIAGGVGAIGLGLTDFMVRHGARKIILLSRRDVNLEDYSKAKEWESMGAQVAVKQCDITQRKDVERLFDEVDNNIAPVDGIFNCAGALQDGLISSQSWEDFQVPLQAKIQGSWWLHEVSKHKSLNWFVLFSSAATVFGSSGQASYAAANAFLDGLAQYRQAHNLTALSINWGPWAGDGMAAAGEVVTNLGRAKGLGLLDTEQAYQTMASLNRHILNNKNSAVNFTVIDVKWKEFSSVIGDDLKATLFSPVVIAAQSSDQASAGFGISIDQFKSEVETVAVEDRLYFIQSKMSEVICELMALPKDHYLDPGEPLQNLGFDSLMALELRNAISKLLGKRLPATLLFDFPTLSLISTFITSEIFPESEVQVETPISEEIEVVEENDEELDMDDLSDSDLAALLAEELD